MSLLTDRELEFLVTLRKSWERLYRRELVRLLKEDTERRSRFDIKDMCSEPTGPLH